MANEERTIGTPGGRNGFVIGIVVGALIVAAAVYLSRKPQQSTPAAAAPVAQEASPQPVSPRATPVSEADLAQVPKISAAELKAKLDSNEAIVIDVRDVNDFIAGHIPGALQIPLVYVQGEIPYFPKDKLIVTYCTCPAEETSGQAVAILRNGGLPNSAALKGGLDAWRALNLEVATGMPPKNS